MTIPLDAWIEETGLERFTLEILPTLQMYGIKEVDDLEDAVRCIMISLRQELKEWRPPNGSSEGTSEG